MQVYYVYRLTCHHPETVKRYYIGFRSCRGNPVTDPYWSSSKPVKEAIARFGPEAFTKKIIAVYPTKKQALALEVKLHARFNVKDHPLFFNRANQTSTKFTTSGSPSEATRAKMVASHLGQVHTPETRAKMAASQRGKTHTPETRAKISAAKRGKPGKPASPETKAKMAEAHRGKELSPTRRRRRWSPPTPDAARRKARRERRSKALRSKALRSAEAYGSVGLWIHRPTEQQEAAT